MFDFFAEILIKLVVYHKNSNMKIESCQFRNGKCYFIKVEVNEKFKSNRSLTIWDKDIHIAREFKMNCQELVETFNVIFKVPKNIFNKILNNLIRTEDFWLFDSNYEFELAFSRKVQLTIKKGINRVKVEKGCLKGGELIPININVYGTELTLTIQQNTSAVFVYNVIATWMGQEPNRIRIKV
jgi:hypothetical protein